MTRVLVCLPRRFRFSPVNATSIDLCTRDFVLHSRNKADTLVLAEHVEKPYDDVPLRLFPPGASKIGIARRIAAEAKLFDPDVVVVEQHFPTADLIRLFGVKVPVIVHTHNYGKPPANWLRRLAHRRRLARLAGVVFVSRAAEDAFRKIWPDLGHLPAGVIHNGLDMALWHPAEKRVPEILVVGRAEPAKGILPAAEGIVAALATRPDWRARFILSEAPNGSGYLAAVRAALAPLGARATVVTDQPFAVVKDANEHAAIAVIASDWEEPFGRTALEAHAGGAAVISSGRGGLREVSGDTAVYISAVTGPAIATAISQLIDVPGRRDSLARAGLARARAEFDIRGQSAKLDALIEARARHR
ncbi:glycosyltransferase family 4 protein [Segnochrobactraceae bacterium EtOH-i3]